MVVGPVNGALEGAPPGDGARGGDDPRKARDWRRTATRRRRALVAIGAPGVLLAQAEPLRAQAQVGHATAHDLVERVEETHASPCKRKVDLGNGDGELPISTLYRYGTIMRGSKEVTIYI